MAIVLVVGAAAVTFHHVRGHGELDWSRPSAVRITLSAIAGLGAAVGVWGSVAALRAVIGWSHPYIPLWSIASVVSVPLSEIVLLAVAAPVVEEIVYRGLLYRTLRTRVPVSLSVAASALLFVAGHVTAAAPTALALGVVTALLYERYGNLWLPIATHAACNISLLSFALLAHHVAGVPGMAV